MAYGARLESGLGITPLTGSNPVSSAGSFTVEKFLVLGRFCAPKPKFLDSERVVVTLGANPQSSTL